MTDPFLASTVINTGVSVSVMLAQRVADALGLDDELVDGLVGGLGLG